MADPVAMRTELHSIMGGARASPTVVIKVGTSSLIRAEHNSLNLSSLAGIVETVRDLRDAGYNAVVVSSGAVGVGCQRLGLTTRPTELAKKQALAAVGQVHLMRYYDDLFSALGLVRAAAARRAAGRCNAADYLGKDWGWLDQKCAQVLLTLDNLANRSQYVNARNTFEELFKYGTVPIVNENDTVAVEQLRIGDNDTLSAQVALLVQADWLFLMTDVNALYTANPSSNPSAQPIHEVPDMSRLQVDTSTAGTQWGTGGMATKLTAARMATAAGCHMVICHYGDPGNVLRVLRGERVGTVFQPTSTPVRGRKRWVLGVPPKGEVWLDAGAVAAVKDRKKSLFSAGISKVVGEFSAQDAVHICEPDGTEFGRGLINYSSDEVQVVKGMSSVQCVAALGYTGQEEVIHRANICLLSGAQDSDDEEQADGGRAEVEGPLRTTTPPPLQASMSTGSIPN